MNARESVSQIVDEWASHHGVRLSCHVRGFPQEHCFAYVSNGLGECCQIVVEALTQGVVTVRVMEIESIGNDQLSGVWRVTASELATTLNTATTLVERWLARLP